MELITGVDFNKLFKLIKQLLNSGPNSSYNEGNQQKSECNLHIFIHNVKFLDYNQLEISWCVAGNNNNI